MKNKTVSGILALAVVTALSFGVILGAKALATDIEGAEEHAPAEFAEEFDTKGAENIVKAGRTEQGYLVTVKTKGYGGDVILDVSFDAEAERVTKVEVVEQHETENLGAKIGEPEFLSQFEGVKAPVYLPGMSFEEENTANLEHVSWQDGTYEAKTPKADENGFVEQITMTVKDGKITEVNWDAVKEDGTKKSVMSENGEYTMTEDGLTWKAQAEALAAALIENQSLEFLSMNEQGKTDAVSGVSISVGSFVNLAGQCLNDAAGMEEEESTPRDGTEIDAVSGATISSTTAVKAVNDAFYYLQSVK